MERRTGFISSQMVKLTVLGSGTCVPHKKRGSSGYLLGTDTGSALFDCGNGVVWKLEKIGVDYLGIDNVFITHFHPDHTSDPDPHFFFATRHPYRKKREKDARDMGAGRIFGICRRTACALQGVGKTRTRGNP